MCYVSAAHESPTAVRGSGDVTLVHPTDVALIVWDTVTRGGDTTPSAAATTHLPTCHRTLSTWPPLDGKKYGEQKLYQIHHFPCDDKQISSYCVSKVVSERFFLFMV